MLQNLQLPSGLQNPQTTTTLSTNSVIMITMTTVTTPTATGSFSLLEVSDIIPDKVLQATLQFQVLNLFISEAALESSLANTSYTLIRL